MNLKSKSCCVFGHRRIEGKAELKLKLTEIIEKLITCENVDTFYLGSKSDFDTLCRELLCEFKEKYSHIKRIYIRAEYPHISDSYKEYLLKSCDKTYFPLKIRNAGRAVYVKRNFEMIDKSDFCIVYYEEEYLPPPKKISKRDLSVTHTKSGTKIAYDYAVKKKRTIINLA